MASSNNGNDKSTPIGGNSSSGVTATGGEPEEQATIGHVSIKPPEFSESDAAGWFAILEAQFVLGRVKASSTKFFIQSLRLRLAWLEGFLQRCWESRVLML